MDKLEAAKVLAIVKACYPQVKIENAESMVNSWVWQLGDLDADLVMQAARLHVSKSKFFPTPADIRENITRASALMLCEKTEKEDQKRLTEKVKTDSGDEIDNELQDVYLLCGLGYENDN